MTTILITGASRGFGALLAEHLLSTGANLILLARDEQRLNDLCQRLLAQCAPQQSLEVIACDLTVDRDVERLLQNQDLWTQVDVLINNAAMQGPIGPCHENDWDAWQTTFKLNFLVPVQLCRALVPFLINKGQGKIINLSGGGATQSRPNFSAYASAKAALVRFTEVLADELNVLGITVNAVAPGPMPTEMLQEVLADPNLLPQEKHALEKAFALGADNMHKAAALIEYLLSSEAAGISGKLISALWDPWEYLHQHLQDLKASDVYTLRRIVPKDRGFNWGEV